jgi:ABC-type transport system involved in multi-copper enzyme maturation permease subunit
VRVIWSIAATTLGEAIRRKVLLTILLIGLLFLSIAPGLGGLTARQETTVLTSMMLGIIQLTSAVIAIVLTVYLIPNEIERRTIYTILSKPVQRWQFLLGKYLGAVLALGLMMLLMSLVLVLSFAFVQAGGLNFSAVNMTDLARLAKAPMFFFIQMSLLAGVAIFFSTFVTPLLNFFLSGGVYFVGSLLNTVYDTFANSPNTSRFVQVGAKIVTTILPNFANYNVQNPIVNPTSQIQNDTMYYIWTTAYGLFYIAVLMVAAILIFDRREV